jgi:hypothetical protein
MRYRYADRQRLQIGGDPLIDSHVKQQNFCLFVDSIDRCEGGGGTETLLHLNYTIVKIHSHTTDRT